MKSLIYGCGCISQGACLKWHSPSFLASRLRLPRVAVFVFFSFLFGFFFLVWLLVFRCKEHFLSVVVSVGTCSI